MSRINNGHGLILVLAVVGCLAAEAHAALVAEMTFQTLNVVPDPDRTTITNNKAGSSNQAQMIIDGGATPASINPTGLTGLGYAFEPEVRIGYLNAPLATSGGVVSINTSGSNGILTNYLTPSVGQGSGAMYGIYKPNFNGTTARNTIFSHRVQNANQLWLFAGESGNHASFYTGGDRFVNLSSASGFSWDSSKWYMTGASWEDTPNGSNVDRQLNIYVRELSESLTTAYTNSATYTNFSQGLLAGAEFYVGRRSNSASEGARGDMSLFRLYDEFFTFADFDLAYNSLFYVPVPEPSSGLLMSLGACVFLARRRKSFRHEAA